MQYARQAVLVNWAAIWTHGAVWGPLLCGFTIRSRSSCISVHKPNLPCMRDNRWSTVMSPGEKAMVIALRIWSASREHNGVSSWQACLAAPSCGVSCEIVDEGSQDCVCAESGHTIPTSLAYLAAAYLAGGIIAADTRERSSPKAARQEGRKGRGLWAVWESER
eukprot:scaffold15944_cov115-Isochrysis_galbana.AAC.2